MRFEFARYTDVTKYAKKLSADNGDMSEYKIYDKILICPDTDDTWIAKIQTGYDSDFEKVEGAVIIERNNIEGFGAKWTDIKSSNYAYAMLMADMEDGCNWDVTDCESVEDAIEMLDDGFGIIKEEE